MEEVIVGRYSMKNIGIFTHDLYPFKPWGQGRYVYDLVRHLRKRLKNKVYVFSPSEGIEDEFHIELFKNSHNTLGKNITFSIKLKGVYEKLIKKYNLGLIHLQGGPGGLFLFRKLSIPSIYTVHHTYYQQSKYIPSQKWKRILFIVEKYSYRLADYLICDSPSTRMNIRKYYGAASDRCSVIPIGVDRNKFHPLHIDKLQNSILFLGRLEERKGIDYLIRAMAKIKKRIKNIQLFIAGEGKLRPILERYVREYRLISNVKFLGVIEDDLINEWYNRVSLVVIPSVFEGFGLTAIEAMSCGTPVISSDVEGLCDLIEDGVNGMLVKYGETGELSEKICNLLKAPAIWKKLNSNGLLHSKKYDWEVITERVLEIYSEHLPLDRK